jgi:hypothetical protein
MLGAQEMPCVRMHLLDPGPGTDEEIAHVVTGRACRT